MNKILTEKYSIDKHLQFEEGPAGFSRAILTHDSGARCEIYLYGAHCISWKTPDGRELLFLSRKAAVTDGAPIRGGIPIIFPQFGSGPLIKHGFARINFWDVAETGISERGEIFLKLRLRTTNAIYDIWQHHFILEYTIILSESLTTSLRVLNNGDSLFSFASAFHTYFNAGDVRDSSIEGLIGCEYIDLIRESRRDNEKENQLFISGTIDRIYLNTPRDLILHNRRMKHRITIKKVGFKDVVVWNPWEEGSKKIKDLEDMDYLSMLCIEAAHCQPQCTLAPGEFWLGVQVLQYIRE